MPNKILQLEEERTKNGVTYQHMFCYRVDIETYRPGATKEPYLVAYVNASQQNGSEFKKDDGQADINIDPVTVTCRFDTAPEAIKNCYAELQRLLLQYGITTLQLPPGEVKDVDQNLG